MHRLNSTIFLPLIDTQQYIYFDKSNWKKFNYSGIYVVFSRTGHSKLHHRSYDCLYVGASIRISKRLDCLYRGRHSNFYLNSIFKNSDPSSICGLVKPMAHGLLKQAEIDLTNSMKPMCNVTIQPYAFDPKINP